MDLDFRNFIFFWSSDLEKLFLIVILGFVCIACEKKEKLAVRDLATLSMDAPEGFWPPDLIPHPHIPHPEQPMEPVLG